MIDKIVSDIKFTPKRGVKGKIHQNKRVIVNSLIKKIKKEWDVPISDEELESFVIKRFTTELLKQ